MIASFLLPSVIRGRSPCEFTDVGITANYKPVGIVHRFRFRIYTDSSCCFYSRRFPALCYRKHIIIQFHAIMKFSPDAQWRRKFAGAVR